MSTSCATFAPTTLFVLAGLLTILGSTDRAIEIARALPFAAKTSLLQWELKLLVLIVIFVHAFFKTPGRCGSLIIAQY